MFYKSVLFKRRDKESWFEGQRYHLGGGLQVAEDDFKENIAKGTDPRIEFCLPKLLILVISQGQTQNLIKFHLRKISTSANISVSTKLRI